MKIVADENITFGTDAFSTLGEVETHNGREISNSILQNADVLIVRAITDVNEKLLMNTSVKFVGTTTIGTDHIDLDYLSKNKIGFADAKGCNADSVLEYVFAALFKIASKENFKLENKTLGVVGVGNIGSKVVKVAETLGMKVKKSDPPLERTGLKGFTNLKDTLDSDIITFHVPLNMEGVDKTFHLIDKVKLDLIKPGTIIINSSRGSVIDNHVLKSEIKNKNLIVVLDVWENEPQIDPELLKEVSIATPHIAGHSYEGKVFGTKFVYDKLCKYLNKEIKWSPPLPVPDNHIKKIDTRKNFERFMNELISSIYNIEEDNHRMQKMPEMGKIEIGKYFDELRKGVPKRREFNNYKIELSEEDAELAKKLGSLRFKFN
jgi:erythronate-4-phosphate dehydrogenase